MINIHPSHRDDLVLENVKILRETGADLKHVVLSHADFAGFSDKAVGALLDMGCTVEWDTFSFEGYYPPYWGHHINLPTDEQRINKIIQYINNGFINQITISTDICLKHLLASYGGGGYDHILRNVLPLMRINGLSNEEIDTLLIENPKRMLPFF
jgi:phosphotriesterase-related protein